MKKLAFVVALVAAAFVVYRVTQDGGAPSGDEAALIDLQERFEAAKERVAAAGRGAGLAGIDTTSDASAEMAEIDRVLVAVQSLARRADDSVRSKAERLERTIRAFKDDND
jgi:hypothetical protein